jgi:hypothetical protein
LSPDQHGETSPREPSSADRRQPEQHERVDDVLLPVAIDARQGAGDHRVVPAPGPDGGLGTMRQADSDGAQQIDAADRIQLAVRQVDEALVVLHLPVLEQALDEAWHAPKVVVEGALAHAEPITQRSDGQCLGPALGQDGQRRIEEAVVRTLPGSRPTAA